MGLWGRLPGEEVVRGHSVEFIELSVRVLSLEGGGFVKNLLDGLAIRLLRVAGHEFVGRADE